MKLEKLLKNAVKIAAVVYTSLATIDVAGAIYSDPLRRFLAQAAALTVIEGAFLLGWWQLDNNRNATSGQRSLYAGITGLAYVALFIIGVQHEGMVGIAFRLTILALVIYSMIDAGILATLKLNRSADRDISRHIAVKRHWRKLAISDAKHATEIDFELAHRQRLIDKGLSEKGQDRDKRERHKTLAQSGDSDAFAAGRRKVNKARQLSRRQRLAATVDALRDTPDASTRQLGDRFGVSHETVRRDIRELQKRGKVAANSDGYQVLVGGNGNGHR